MNTNMRLDPIGNNPIHNISDPFKHEALWDEFILKTGVEANRLYEEHEVRPTDLGLVVRQMSHSPHMETADPFAAWTNTVVFTAVAYHLHLHELAIRKFATTAVALHYPREEIFDLTLIAKFGVNKFHLGTSQYELMRGYFNAWLATFGPDVLRLNKESGK